MKMKRGEHLTTEGLQDIINLKATLNKGFTPLLQEAFPECIPVPRSTPFLKGVGPTPFSPSHEVDGVAGWIFIPPPFYSPPIWGGDKRGGGGENRQIPDPPPFKGWIHPNNPLAHSGS